MVTHGSCLTLSSQSGADERGECRLGEGRRGGLLHQSGADDRGECCLGEGRRGGLLHQSGTRLTFLPPATVRTMAMCMAGRVLITLDEDDNLAC